ncbi:TauD/TfdA family dioxygenase [Pseudoalteromonas rubra]|uniref:TauD/TfdA family dioxygenase n=1 Tax=Pseudoalteromonas rubra TaxID=43658 RepID=UPI000698DB3B|nr:TauD/TfdA family dioxygenase [Pseudoalteromonas rubra]
MEAVLDFHQHNLATDIQTGTNACTLSKSSLAEILSAIRAEKLSYTNENFEEFYWQCFYASFKLPVDFQKFLFDFKALESESYLHIKGLHIPENLGPTPLSFAQAKNVKVNEIRTLMSVILSRFGLVYAFKGKKNFDFIDDVFPIEAHKTEQLGTNNSFLEWHVEDGFHDAKADWVALYCLKGDLDAQTYLFQSKDIRLDEQTMAELRKPNFEIQVDPTFSGAGAPNKRVAILSRHAEPEIVFDPAYMVCLTEEAQAALTKLQDFINENKRSITLAPGEMLVFDNRKVVHARSEYQPLYDGTDRWLLRALVLESKFKARECFSAGTLMVE